MAQGNLKLKGSSKSQGAKKRQTIRAKTLTAKGRKHYSAKSHKASSIRADQAVSKDIAKKNESLIAAKAISAGNRFFLNDVSEKGKKEQQKQLSERDRKQSKATKMSERMKAQLKSLKEE